MSSSDGSARSVKVERLGRITVVTIDRQHVRNALDAEAHAALAQAFDDFGNDTGQWVAIITGAGSAAFCAGHDLRTPAPEGPNDLPPSGFGGLTARFNLDKPVIAAVNGVAVGGGFEMVLACDIVVASRSASFALPEVKVGMAALGGGALRLSRQIGHQRAMGLLLTGRRVGAAEAFDLGFVTEVVDGDAMVGATRWAEQLLTCSPMATRATKRVALDCAVEPLAVAMDRQWKLPAVTRLHLSADAREGPAAFNARRPPTWTAL